MTHYYCHRVWSARSGGVHLCTLRTGHGGTRCIDTVNNKSYPTHATGPSAWDRVMARLGQES